MQSDESKHMPAPENAVKLIDDRPTRLWNHGD